MCFAGPSFGNSADADQMSPDVSSLLNEVYLYPKLITGLKFYMCGDTTSLQFYLGCLFWKQIWQSVDICNFTQQWLF